MNKKNRHPIRTFNLIKAILIVIHIAALLLFLTGVTFIYSNEHLKVGIAEFNAGIYEDSPVFLDQYNQDIQYVFDYLDNKDTFETDNRFDPDKKIFSINEGPGMDTEYSVDDVITAARRRGYYLDEHYQVLSIPDIVSSNDNSKTYLVNWKNYTDPHVITGPGDYYVSIDDLIQEVLNKLSKYYAAYDRLYINPSNFQFLAEYNGISFTNNRSLSPQNAVLYGRYAICHSDSMAIDTNLLSVPAAFGYLSENSIYNAEGPFTVYTSVDTNYPNEDVYRTEAISYRQERETFASELLMTIIGGIVCVITLIALLIITLRYKEINADYPIFGKTNRSFEGRIITCALAIIVLLFLNEKLFKRVMHLYVPFEYWEFGERAMGYAFVYGCVMITIFSLIRSAQSGDLWQNSLTRTLYEKIDRFLEEQKFSRRTVILFVGYLLINVALLVSAILLLVYQKTLVQRFIGLALILVFLIFNFYVLMQLFKKQQQHDKIETAIENITQGDTSYQIDISGFDGKEKEIAEGLNSIGSGLEKALNEQVKSERLKADLITNVSHDIKTPLTSIINYIDLIKRENPSEPKIVEYLSVLEQKSQHLKNLTEDLVEASKATSGNVSLDIQRIDFVELVKEANGEFEEKYSERHLEIVAKLPDEAVIIEADGARLWRVLENIYGNVYKYAADSSRVYVDMVKEGEAVQLTLKNVSANPLNIRADELTERFVRGDISRSTEGSGLGLSIAESLTRMQGGTFKIEIDGDLFKVHIRFNSVAG